MEIKYNLPGTFKRKLLYPKLDYILNNLNETLKYTQVYDYAKKIYIIAGELFPDFYNNKLFLKYLRSSIENYNAEVKVIFGPALYVNAEDFLTFSIKNEKVNLFNRRKREASHFKIIENINGEKFAFVDEPHGVKVDKRKGVLLTNDYKDIISLLEKKFEKELIECEPIEKQYLIEKFSNRTKKRVNGEWEYIGFIYKKDNEVDLASDEQIEKLKENIIKNLQ